VPLRPGDAPGVDVGEGGGGGDGKFPRKPGDACFGSCSLLGIVKVEVVSWPVRFGPDYRSEVNHRHPLITGGSA